MRKKWVLGCFATPVLLALLAFVVVKWMARNQPPWPEPKSGVSLSPPYPVLDTLEEDNGVFHLLALLDSLEADGLDLEAQRYLADDLGFGETSAELDDFYAARPYIRQRFVQATDCDFWQARTVTELERASVINPVPLLHLFELNLHRMEEMAVRGDWLGVEELLRRQFDASYGYARGGGLIPWSVMMAGERKNMRGISTILAATDPPAETLDALDTLLTNGLQSREPSENVLRTEWIAMSNSIASVFEASPFAGGSSFQSRTLGHVGALWSHVIHDMEIPFGPDTTGDWIDQVRQDRMWWAAKDPLGRFIGLSQVRGLISDTRSDVRFRHHQTLLMYAATRVHLGLERYHQKNGGYPEQLSELVPGMLTKVPVDFCSPDGQPISYEKTDTGFTLYSLGWNRTDERGDRNQDEVFHPNERTVELELE